MGLYREAWNANGNYFHPPESPRDFGTRSFTDGRHPRRVKFTVCGAYVAGHSGKFANLLYSTVAELPCRPRRRAHSPSSSSSLSQKAEALPADSRSPPRAMPAAPGRLRDTVLYTVRELAESTTPVGRFGRRRMPFAAFVDESAGENPRERAGRRGEERRGEARRGEETRPNGGRAGESPSPALAFCCTEGRHAGSRARPI